MITLKPVDSHLSFVGGRARALASDEAVRVIGIVVFDQFSLLEVAEVADVFDKANRRTAGSAAGRARYRTTFLSPNGGAVSSSCFVSVLTQPLATVGSLHGLFIVSGQALENALCDAQFMSMLQRAKANCENVFLIGVGIQAALSRWQDTGAEPLPIRSFTPRFRSHENSPGQSAMEHAHELVRVDLGESATYQNADNLPAAIGSSESHQAGRLTTSMRQKIVDSARWITLNCDKPISVVIAAERAGMSDRSYLRHFRAEMGVTPSAHLRQARLERAATLLIGSDLPVDKIARRSGLANGECLARLFRQMMHVSPTEYRSQMRT